MPGADDKVVLQVMIDIADSKKQFKGLEDVLKKVAKQSTKMTSASDKAIKDQMRSVQGLAKAHKEAANAAVQAEKRKQQEIQKTTKSQKEAQEEMKKSMGMFEKMGKRISDWQKGGGFGRAGRAVGRGIGRGARAIPGAAMSLGSGLLGFAMGGMTNAFSTWQQYGAARFGLTGTGASVKGMARATRAGTGLGFTPIQTVSQAPGVARAAGAAERVTLAQQLALGGGGMQVGEATGIMGALRQAGVTFGGQARAGGSTEQRMFRQQRQGAKELSRLVEGGLISGLERARLPEYLQGVSQIAEEVGGRQTGRVNVRDIGALIAQIGQVPGMQGRRGIQMARQLDQAIRAPGGGEAGQQLILQSLGFGKPGGSRDYYSAIRQQQRGLFGEGGAQTLTKVLGEITQQYGVVGAGGKSPQMEEANLVASQQLGLTIDQVEALQEVNNSNMDQKEKLKKIKEQMEKAMPIEKQALKASKEGFAGIAKRLAGLQAANIGIGAKLAGPMIQLQNIQMRFLKDIAPFVADALKMLVKLLKMIYGSISSLVNALKKWGPIKKLFETTKEREKRLREEGAYIEKPQRKVDYMLKRMGQATTFGEVIRRQQLRSKADFKSWIRARGKERGGAMAGAESELKARYERVNELRRVLKKGRYSLAASPDPAVIQAGEAFLRAAGGRSKDIALQKLTAAMQKHRGSLTMDPRGKRLTPEQLQMWQRSQQRDPTAGWDIPKRGQLRKIRKGAFTDPTAPTPEQIEGLKPGSTVPAGTRTITVPVTETNPRKLQGTPVQD